MLKKLLKHEYKATARFFLPVYGCFAILMVVQRLSMLWASSMAKNTDFLGGLARVVLSLFSVASVIALIALLICPMIFGIIRFYKNMLSDEGYLSFTLPVTPGQHLISKLLVVLFWQILTIIVVIGCGVLFFLTVNPLKVKEQLFILGDFFPFFFSECGSWGILVLVLLVLGVLSQMVENVLRLYNAMSIGQCSSSHKLLASVAVYIAHNLVLSILLQIPALLFFGASKWSGPLESLIYGATSSSSVSVGLCQMICIFLASSIVINILLSTAYFFISRYFLTKKLNLA